MKNGLKAQHSKKEDHDIWSRHVMANRGENSGNSDRLYFCGQDALAEKIISDIKSLI